MILETKRLTKKYRDLVAVNSVDLQVCEGEVFGFLGPNGAGKTTTLGMILGLIHPTSGSVEVLGQSVTPYRNSVLRQVGAMFGASGMVPFFSAVENLSALSRIEPLVNRERIYEILEEVNLVDAGRRPYRTYSTGMKQRLGLAAALLHRPKLLVLDEPTNGLDPSGIKEFRQLIRKQSQNGVTVLLSSHLLHEVEQVCDRVAILNRGQVVSQGSMDDLRKKYSQRVCIQVPESQSAVKVLQELPGIQNITVEDSQVWVEGLPSTILLKALLDHQLIPLECHEDHKDLETIFLELTQ